MKRFILVLFFCMFGLFFPKQVFASYNYYDKDTDILLVSDVELKYGFIDTTGTIQAHNFLFAIVRYNHDEMEKQGITKEEMGTGIVDDDYYLGKFHYEDEGIYATIAYTYDEEYFYKYVFSSKEDSEEITRNMTRIIVNSKYRYKSTGNTNNNSGSNNTNNITQSNNSYNGNSSGSITIYDGNGNVTYEEIIDNNRNKYLAKSNRIKIIGTLICTILGIINLINRKNKLRVSSIFGILLLVDQVVRYFSNNIILVSGERVEILYTLFYFLPGIFGLMLISKQD